MLRTCPSISDFICFVSIFFHDPEKSERSAPAGLLLKIRIAAILSSNSLRFLTPVRAKGLITFGARQAELPGRRGLCRRHYLVDNFRTGVIVFEIQSHSMAIIRGDRYSKVKPLRKIKSREWTLPDIVDLEYFLEQDQQIQGEDALKKRDRTFYLNHIRPGMDPLVSQNQDPGPVAEKEIQSPGKQAIFQWLGLRRTGQAQGTLLPGAIYREASSLMAWCFFLGGLLLGTAVVASFFSYSGARPLNISYYLSLTLLGQLMLLALCVAGLWVAGNGRISPPMPVLQRLFGLLLHRMMRKIREKSMQHIPRNHQEAMVYALGLVRARHRIYGSVFLWPFVSPGTAVCPGL